MKNNSPSEKLLVEEITAVGQRAKIAIRGLSIGPLIKSIRTQLGMSQKILSTKAGIPQSTVSRIEQGQKDMSVSTLVTILNALSSDLIILPVMRAPVDTIRFNQAKKIAINQIRYLDGTMNLENQQPDSRFVEELLKQEIEHLLQAPNSKLWNEESLNDRTI